MTDQPTSDQTPATEPVRQPYPFKTFTQRHKGLMSRSRVGEMRFTRRGLFELERALLADCTLEEVADYFCAPAAEISRLLGEGGQAHNVARRCKAEVRMVLREKQFAVAGDNATMAAFLGKQILGQRDEQHLIQQGEQVVRHVIGAMPDYKMTPEQWQKQFAPDEIREVSTIEELKKLNKPEVKDGDND